MPTMAHALTLSTAALTPPERRAAAMVGARAFFTDPFFRFLSPDAILRNLGLTTYMTTMLNHLGPVGQVTTVRTGDGELAGVSIWQPPGGYPLPVSVQLAQLPGTLRSLYRRPRALRDGTTYLNAVAKVHPKNPHWYLQLLVCEPEQQRQGVGTMLLEHQLGLVDRDGLPAYLETQKESNLSYYRRFGFTEVTELRPRRDGPPLWTLTRPAR